MRPVRGAPGGTGYPGGTGRAWGACAGYAGDIGYAEGAGVAGDLGGTGETGGATDEGGVLTGYVGIEPLDTGYVGAELLDTGYVGEGTLDVVGAGLATLGADGGTGLEATEAAGAEVDPWRRRRAPWTAAVKEGSDFASIQSSKPGYTPGWATTPIHRSGYH